MIEKLDYKEIENTALILIKINISKIKVLGFVDN